MATKKKKTQIAERLRTMEGFHRGDIDNLTTRDGQRSHLPDGKPIALPELGAGGEEPGKRVIADTRDNAQGLAATGEGEGPTVRAPRTALDDPRSRVEAGLFDVAGVDALEAGGFAKRDEVRAALRRGTTEERKIKRATNLAYREALRRGDRAGALNIRKQARGEGITFGGVSGAGDIERSVAQGIGEQLRTRSALTQRPAPVAQADQKSVDQDEITIDDNKGLIKEQSQRARRGLSGLFGKRRKFA
jgi:hypothetical protein